MDAQLKAAAEKAGIIFANDAVLMAADAQPSAVTVANAGIPALLSTFIDPKVIEVLVSPMKAVEIVGDETKKGDWTTTTAMFNVIESTGEVATYGDYSNNGSANSNFNFPQRQSYLYQTIVKYGELELENAGLAKIDLATRKNVAAALVLNKFQNKTYFFGVSGLQNYGLLNDPSLSAAITPTTKAAGGTTWAVATANEILDDVTKMFKQLQTQLNGNVQLDSAMTLAMSPLSEVYLTKTTSFNVNVQDLLKKNYPNLTVKTAPEYTTGSGELMQLIANNVDGQQAATCAFNEKMRSHRVIVDHSSYAQKKTGGTFGTVVFLPAAISSMIGA